MVHFPSTLSNVRLAVVASFSALIPAFESSARGRHRETAGMGRRDEFFGLVATASPNRDWNEYGVSFKTPLCDETVPLPSLSVPCQTSGSRCVS